MDTSRLAELLKGAKEDYLQLANAYPNAAKFVNALRGNIEQNVPTQADFENPQAMADWSQAAALNAPMGLTFAGKLAKNAPLEKFAEAERLAQSQGLQDLPMGSDAWHDINRGIHAQTGIHYGADMQPRFEISDNLSKLRDYQYTPKEAYKNASFEAFVNDTPRDRVKAMFPYVDMTKNQLMDKYKKTGQEIIDQAISGNIDFAKQISRDRVGLDDLLGEMANRRSGVVSNFLKHGELNESYPDAYKTLLNVDNLLESGGVYRQETPQRKEIIELKEKPRFNDQKSLLLHEIQHAIQQREGWSKGGNPREFPDTSALKRELHDANLLRRMYMGANDLEAAKKRFFEVTKREPDRSIEPYALSNQNPDEYIKQADLLLTPEESYMRLAGEAEARATQSRMNLTPEERAVRYPFEDYDRAAKDLIVRGLRGQ